MARLVEFVGPFIALGGWTLMAARWYNRRARRQRSESHPEHVRELLAENEAMDYMIDKMKRDERRAS